MPKAKANPNRAKFSIEFVESRTKAREKFYWKIVSINGNIICHSEMFRQKQGPVKTVKSLIEAIKAGNIRVKHDDYTVEVDR